MVVEIQCSVSSTNQHAQRPSPAHESTRPMKKYYVASRDFLWSNFYLELYLELVPAVETHRVPAQSSCGGNRANDIHCFEADLRK